MKWTWVPAIGIVVCYCSACSLIEQSSRHGFNSGYFTVKTDSARFKKAYVVVQDDSIMVHQKNADTLQGLPAFSISLFDSDTACNYSYSFNKQSLDIDITSILLKYRPGRYGLPSELTADFNAALYTGWRWDYYTIKSKKDPFQKSKKEISGRGFDFGVFAGLGTAPVNSFNTLGMVYEEYSGMVFQYGMAGFIETKLVSFGLGVGFDALLTPDKKSWKYHNKPWFGFLVGIALN